MINTALWYRGFGHPIDVLSLESHEKTPLPDGMIRVRMQYSPVNPSDLIPVTGAYQHRVSPDRVAGYEGVGVVIDAPGAANNLVGKRILPLRGEGTWQTLVDTDPLWAILVPDDIDDIAASRAYINPLAAYLMLKTWVPTQKRILLTAAASDCARYLGQWAALSGASTIAGVYRSEKHYQTLQKSGIHPIAQNNTHELASFARHADLVFDAVGGETANTILHSMRDDGVFISYGLLSGQLYRLNRNGPKVFRFHIRDHLTHLSPADWQAWFQDIWPLLRTSHPRPATCFPIADWENALHLFYCSGRDSKPVIAF